MNKKSLLYIGHSYHNKTKSTAFLKELLEKNYHLTVFDFSPDTERYDKLLVFKDVCFDCLVLFQITPDLEKDITSNNTIVICDKSMQEIHG